MLTLKRFETDDAEHHAAAATIWNAACGLDLAIGPAAVHFNTLPTTGATRAGQVAAVDTEGAQSGGQAVGFVLASAFPEGDPAVSPREMGWVDAIAVSPGYQRRGIGAALLAWAERWLAGHGCTHFRLGGSLRPFAPGLPSGMSSERFFRGRGYDNRPRNGIDWDVAYDLRGYTTPPGLRAGLPVHARPARPGEEDALLTFLHREFPGRWRFEAQEFLSSGGRISDFMLLLTANGVDGFCQLTFEDSLRPLDRYFMHRLPCPWGQLGPIGVSEGCRGMGCGAALLDAGLRRLRDDGVAGCVIDWTTLLEFYGKFGFWPYRRYEMLLKVIGP